MPLEGKSKSQLKRSLVFLGHPLYYNQLDTLTFKQELRQLSTPSRKVKGRGDNTATVLRASIFQCYPKHLSLLLLSVFKLPTVLGEVMCKPGCPHSLTLKPQEHLAGLVPVPGPRAAEPPALFSG